MNLLLISLYGFSFLAALWGFTLFSWWWMKTWRLTRERPSSIFICLWMIFFGEILDNGMSFYMRRSIINSNLDDTNLFFNTWMWPTRVVPILVALLAVDVIMTYRIIYKKHLFKANGHS